MRNVAKRRDYYAPAELLLCYYCRNRRLTPCRKLTRMLNPARSELIVIYYHFSRPNFLHSANASFRVLRQTMMRILLKMGMIVSGIMTLTRTPCELDKMSLFQDLKLKRRKIDSRCSSDGECMN